MANNAELTPQQKFEEQVISRMRESIGTLIPDDVLRQMMEKAIDKMFFTRREKKNEGYGARVEVFPSWFEEECEKQLGECVAAAVKNWLEANSEAMIKAAADHITAKAPELIANFLFDAFRGTAFNLQYSLSNQIHQELTERLRNIGR